MRIRNKFMSTNNNQKVFTKCTSKDGRFLGRRGTSARRGACVCASAMQAVYRLSISGTYILQSLSYMQSAPPEQQQAPEQEVPSPDDEAFQGTQGSGEAYGDFGGFAEAQPEAAEQQMPHQENGSAPLGEEFGFAPPADGDGLVEQAPAEVRNPRLAHLRLLLKYPDASARLWYWKSLRA
eukprot:1159908-Pelagomonas_calceolata.AAC.1